MKAKFTTLQRIHNRLWTELSKPLTQHAPSSLHSVETSAKSISGSHPWIDVCAGYADGEITSKRFRRFDAVREIVETLGATDGRHFAKIIEMWDPLALRHEAFKAIDSWGDPIRWPGPPARQALSLQPYLAPIPSTCALDEAQRLHRR